MNLLFAGFVLIFKCNKIVEVKETKKKKKTRLINQVTFWLKSSKSCCSEAVSTEISHLKSVNAAAQLLLRKAFSKHLESMFNPKCS